MDIRDINKIETETKEFDWRFIFGPYNSEFKGGSIDYCQLPVGGDNSLHVHTECYEIYYILSGSGEIIVDEEHSTIDEGQAVHILPNKKRQLKNIGSKPLKYLAFFVPPHRTSEIYNYGPNGEIIRDTQHYGKLRLKRSSDRKRP